MRVMLDTSAGDLEKQRRKKKSEWIWRAVGVGLILVFVWLSVSFYRAYPFGQFKGFSVPSASMCPTICENERIIAAMDAYSKSRPQRGDVVIVLVPSISRPVVKRIAGIEGDLVSPGPEGTILANGKKLNPPRLCGNVKAINSLSAEPVEFAPVKVPQGQYFLIGDNLANSYDSRHFGVVDSKQVLGKALFIYWSSRFSRIGCHVE